MSLQRQRLVGREHFDQERQRIAEPGARRRAELSVGVSGQGLQERDVALLGFEAGRILRVRAQPQLGLRMRRPAPAGR